MTVGKVVVVTVGMVAVETGVSAVGWTEVVLSLEKNCWLSDPGRWHRRRKHLPRIG